MLPKQHLNLTIKAYQGSGNGSRWRISSLINWYCKGDHHLIFLPFPTCTTNSSKVSLHSITSKLLAISPNTPDCPDTDVWTLVLEATIGNFIPKAKLYVITMISLECLAIIKSPCIVSTPANWKVIPPILLTFINMKIIGYVEYKLDVQLEWVIRFLTLRVLLWYDISKYFGIHFYSYHSIMASYKFECSHLS